MSDDKDTGKGLFKANWHRTPTAMIDLIMGTSISPSAGWVVMTVIRYTQGMGGKKSAAIPTGTFKRVLGTKRDNTVYRYINEAIESGLIEVSKKKGCVSTYSVNENCELWSKQPLSESDTTNDKQSIPLTQSDSTPLTQSDIGGVSESDTGPLSESDTLIKRDIYKDSFKEQEEFDLFNDRYESIKIMLKQSGIIPIAKPINDEWLKPEVYRFNLWFTGKGIDSKFLMQQAATWFNKKTIEERKAYYTFPEESGRNYYTGSNEPKAAKVTDERAAEIRAQYMGVIGF